MKLIEGTQIEKPTARGKFSTDSDLWNQIHQQRFAQWQMGRSLEDIAAEEGVTVNAIRNSIFRCEVKLPGGEALAIRERRQKLVTIGRLGAKCVDVLEKLLEDESPLIRLRAVEQTRKATTSESGTGLQVNTQVNVANNPGGETYDFETQLAEIRRKQKAAHEGSRSGLRSQGCREIIASNHDEGGE